MGPVAQSRAPERRADNPAHGPAGDNESCWRRRPRVKNRPSATRAPLRPHRPPNRSICLPRARRSNKWLSARTGAQIIRPVGRKRVRPTVSVGRPGSRCCSTCSHYLMNCAKQLATAERERALAWLARAAPGRLAEFMYFSGPFNSGGKAARPAAPPWRAPLSAPARPAGPRRPRASSWPPPAEPHEREPLDAAARAQHIARAPQ